MNPELFKPLCELDLWLEENDKSLHLEIIGGFALELHRVEIMRSTTDIDNIATISDNDILHKIKEIGLLHGMVDWIDQPILPLPEGYKVVDAKAFKGFKKISGKVLTNHYIIIMKVASYFDRMHITARDLEDVNAINKSEKIFTKELFDIAIDFTKTSRNVKSADELERLNEVKESFINLL